MKAEMNMTRKNTSIEAARARESGQGFSLVATTEGAKKFPDMAEQSAKCLSESVEHFEI